MDISPHIVVRGGAAAAADWYVAALGFEELSRLEVPDGRHMSIVLRYGDSELHLCDEFPELGVAAPPAASGALELSTEDAAALFDRAIAAGATVVTPVAEGFWGALHGQFDDAFGHRWNVSQQLREVPLDEQRAAVAAMFSA